MNKKFIFILCFIAQHSLFSIGAGAAFYRYNSKGQLEFLLARDPNYIGHAIRSGFEFPGGTICDHPHVDRCNAKNLATITNLANADMAYGGFREALEETCFVPVSHSKLGLVGGPYYSTNKTVNHSYESDAVNAIVHMSRLQGGMYIFKHNDSGGAGDPNSRAACFLCDITDIMLPKFLKAMEQQRQTLIHQKFSMHAVGAEPDAFAWVSGAELLRIINLAAAKGSSLNDQERLVVANQLTPMVVDNQNIFAQHGDKLFKVMLSRACVGMIRDRVHDAKNPQPNELHRNDGQPSSMRAILEHLMLVAPKAVPKVVPVEPKIVPKAIQIKDSDLQKILTDIGRGVYDNEIIQMLHNDMQDSFEMFQHGFTVIGDVLRSFILSNAHPIAQDIRNAVEQKIVAHRRILAKGRAKSSVLQPKAGDRRLIARLERAVRVVRALSLYR